MLISPHANRHSQTCPDRFVATSHRLFLITTGIRLKAIFLSHLRTFRIPNYCCDWKLPGQPFYAYVMARWMAEHEVLAAAIFVALSLALTALFAAMERHYKQQLTSRGKNDFS
jgi:hypothetical protein